MRVSLDAARVVTGIVERVRTKHRFSSSGVENLAAQEWTKSAPPGPG